MMVFQYMGTRQRAVSAPEVVTSIVDGKEVTSTITVTRVVPEPFPIKSSLNPKTTRLTNTKGEAVAEDDLKKRLEQAVTVVRMVGPMEAEWRKFFTDDVLFLEAGPVAVPRGMIGPAPAILPPPPPPVIK
jgi:hypothetical protein